MDKTLLIAFEGSDSTGKETQSNLLKEWFLLNERTVASFSFPLYKKTAGGLALYEALKGDNKEAYRFSTVDPFAASLFYSADRREALPLLQEAINTHDVIIFDRYVDSNLIHQGGKFASEKKRSEFGDFVYGLEYELLKLPKPDVTVYLDLPAHVAIRRAEERASKLGKSPDAVEADHDYIRNSHAAGSFYAKKFSWLTIPCVRADGYEYSREEIAALVQEKLTERFHLAF